MLLTSHCVAAAVRGPGKLTNTGKASVFQAWGLQLFAWARVCRRKEKIRSSGLAYHGDTACACAAPITPDMVAATPRRVNSGASALVSLHHGHQPRTACRLSVLPAAALSCRAFSTFHIFIMVSHSSAAAAAFIQLGAALPSIWGFSGSRHSGPWSVAAGACASHLAACCSSCFSPSPSSCGCCAVHLVVGCASGTDQAVRQAVPWALVFSVVRPVAGPWVFAARSVRLVAALAAGRGSLASFPSSPCPAGVVVQSHFSGCGSGSWGTVAFSLHLCVAVFLFVPAGAVPAGASPLSFAGPLASRFSVGASGPWGAWLLSTPAPVGLFG